MKNRIFKLPEIAKMDAKIAQHTLLKCLLVDDNPDDRALATRALEREFPEMQTEFVTDMDRLSITLDRRSERSTHD
jgi:response regulator RpfG family c-di-GMP phosphodiesterase